MYKVYLSRIYTGNSYESWWQIKKFDKEEEFENYDTGNFAVLSFKSKKSLYKFLFEEILKQRPYNTTIRMGEYLPNYEINKRLKFLRKQIRNL